MGNKLKTFGFIFARGGSKGVPGKNIKLLAGKPLIHYAVEAACACSYIDRVFVSTDDEAIAEQARIAGAEVPFIRPRELALDDSPEWLAWQHAIRFLKDRGDDFNLFVSIPATSPLRSVEDIDNVVSVMAGDETVDGVMTVTPAHRHPSFNMVVLDESQSPSIAVPASTWISRRQDAPLMYDVTTVAYAGKSDFILNSTSLFDGNLKVVIVPQERALDIDTEFDFKIAECLICGKRRE